MSQTQSGHTCLLGVGPMYYFAQSVHMETVWPQASQLGIHLTCTSQQSQFASCSHSPSQSNNTFTHFSNFSGTEIQSHLRKTILTLSPRTKQRVADFHLKQNFPQVVEKERLDCSSSSTNKKCKLRDAAESMLQQSVLQQRSTRSKTKFGTIFNFTQNNNERRQVKWWD